MTRFLLLRHAQSEWNAVGRIQGATDIRLSRDGRSMAAMWAEVMTGVEFDAVLHSDLCRAAETARIVTGERRAEMPRLTDTRLREQDWGAWVGKSLPEIAAGKDFATQTARGWEFRPPQGESRREVLDRATAALVDAGTAHPGRTWLVVSHQGVIKALVYHLSGHDMLPGNQLLDKRYRLYELLLKDGRLSYLGPRLELPT